MTTITKASNYRKIFTSHSNVSREEIETVQAAADQLNLNQNSTPDTIIKQFELLRQMGTSSTQPTSHQSGQVVGEEKESSTSNGPRVSTASASSTTTTAAATTSQSNQVASTTQNTTTTTNSINLNNLPSDDKIIQIIKQTTKKAVDLKIQQLQNNWVSGESLLKKLNKKYDKNTKILEKLTSSTDRNEKIISYLQKRGKVQLELLREFDQGSIVGLCSTDKSKSSLVELVSNKNDDNDDNMVDLTENDNSPTIDEIKTTQSSESKPSITPLAKNILSMRLQNDQKILSPRSNKSSLPEGTKTEIKKIVNSELQAQSRGDQNILKKADFQSKTMPFDTIFWVRKTKKNSKIKSFIFENIFLPPLFSRSTTSKNNHLQAHPNLPHQ